MKTFSQNSIHWDTNTLWKQLELALEWTLESMETIRHGTPDWFAGYYFSATDLECRVRAAAAELIDGSPYGSQQNRGGGIRILGLRRLSLLSHCRRFLLQKVREGVLRADQPSGRRTISALRYRPAEMDITEAEKRTAERRSDKRHIICHFDPDYEKMAHIGMEPICQKARRDIIKKANNFPSRARRRRAFFVTADPTKVTCKNCKKSLARYPHPLAPELKANTNPLIVADWLEDNNKPELASKLREEHGIKTH